MEGELQYQGQIDQYLEEWLSTRGSQPDRGFFSEEEKQESIRIEYSAPEGAIISNQAPEGEKYNMVVVKWSYKVEGSGDNIDTPLCGGLYKEEDDSLMRRDTWEIVLRKSIADHNVLPGTWSFKCKRKPDWKIRKFKARYCVRGGIQKRLYPKPLNSYYPVVQWATVSLMLILQCIPSQIIDSKNASAQADIPSGEQVFIELHRYFKSDGGQHDVILRLKKSL